MDGIWPRGRTGCRRSRSHIVIRRPTVQTQSRRERREHNEGHELTGLLAAEPQVQPKAPEAHDAMAARHPNSLLLPGQRRAGLLAEAGTWGVRLRAELLVSCRQMIQRPPHRRHAEAFRLTDLGPSELSPERTAGGVGTGNPCDQNPRHRTQNQNAPQRERPAQPPRLLSEGDKGREDPVAEGSPAWGRATKLDPARSEASPMELPVLSAIATTQ